VKILEFDEYFGKEKFSALPSKNKVADGKLNIVISVPLKMNFFVNHFVVRRQPAEFVFKKNRQMNAVCLTRLIQLRYYNPLV
jgi:hypothetical protein